jgi:hypothetical protein
LANAAAADLCGSVTEGAFGSYWEDIMFHRTVIWIIMLAVTPLIIIANAIAEEMPSISKFVENEKLEKVDSFLTVYKSDTNSNIYIVIPESGGSDLYYQSFLKSGFGSRDLANPGSVDALDRGKFGQGGLAAFRWFGKRVLLIQRNTNYYTPLSTLDSPDDAGLSFPNSAIASFDVKALEGGKLLIDATKFFSRDGMNIPGVLKASGQGSYSFETERSAIDVSHVHTTQDSIGVDTLLTFSTSEAPPDRDILSRVAADRSAILVRERNVLIRLPDLMTTTFRPRIFDARSGFFDNTYQNLSMLPNGSTRQSFIVRFALSKKSPAENVSEPDRPIVFYIEPTVPKDLHPLIAEAASWWNPAPG